MKKFALCTVVLLAVMLVCAAWAGEAEKPEPQLCLDIDLVDGSRIIGTPGIESVPVQTSYAKMDVRLDQILFIKMGEDHETASLDLRNGDKLKGVIDLRLIKLETVFGRVSLVVEHIRGLRVLIGGRDLPEALKQGLILRYTFDDDAGPQVADSSGNGNHGQALNPSRLADARVPGNFVRSFDGVKDQVLIPGEAPFRFGSQDFTVAMRIRPSVLGAYRRTLASKYSDAKRDWILMLHPDGRLEFSTSGSGGDLSRSTTRSAVAVGEWHHVAVVKTGAAAAFYVDGRRQDDDGAALHAVRRSGDEPVRLGAYRGGDGTIGDGSHLFGGCMDDVTIYSRALTPDEVALLCR